MFRPRVPLLVCSLVVCCQVSLRADLTPETGSFWITSFPGKIYDASPQNWAILQDRRGVMYFGNTEGILEFDGASWRRISIDAGAVRTLSRDAKGTIYAGGDGVIGYLQPDRSGTLQFVSLLNSLSPGDRQLGPVLRSLAAPEGVYFVSRQKLVLAAQNGHLKVWKPAGILRPLIFRASNRVYVVSSESGLLTVEGDQLVACPWGSQFLSDPPVTASTWGDDVLVASRQRIYRVRGQTVERFSTTADAYLLEHQVYFLDSLRNGDLVVGTRTGGLVVVDQKHGRMRVVTRSSGLPSNFVTASLLGREGNLWVTTNAGLAHLLPYLTHFTETEGITGNIYSVARQDGILYVGSTAGLYRLQASDPAEARFQRLSSIRSGITVWSIGQAGLPLIGADDGIYAIAGDQAIHVLPSQVVYDLQPSEHNPKTVYAAGRDGVLVLQQIGSTWAVTSRERGEGQEFRTVAEDQDGRVWATTRSSVWRFDFRTNPATTERFDRAQGLPAGWKNVYSLRKHIVFATDKGLMQFSQSQQRFVPDPELGDQFCDGTKPVFLLLEDPKQNTWISGKGYHGFISRLPSGQNRWVETPLLASGIEEIWGLYVDADGTAWASGAEGGLFRWDPGQDKARDDKFQVLIRGVSVTESKTTLFGGDGTPLSQLTVPFAQNALRFEFATPSYKTPSAVRYQFILEGSERNWSPWTTETQKDFTNLPPHRFRFRVRARDNQGVVSPEAVFAFRVLPPWYRTWWAYLLYFVGLVLLSRFVFRWRLRVLRAHNQRLETLIEQRTMEVRTQRDQNEALLLNILPAPVASELRCSGSVAPTSFEDVTVCFTDFVGFTLSSESLPAGQLVSALNEYFTRFDAIMERYGLEKLKTIGDSYMFVSGLPERRPSHAVDAVLAALELVHVSQQVAQSDRGVSWKMRVGLFSGPVIAGVVGKSKFAFDVWGSTVNLASRMESSGVADRVNLSASTFNLVRQLIDCEPRGRVCTKEGREMEMYFALGPRSELTQGPKVDGIPIAFRTAYEAAFSRPLRAFPTFLLQSEPAMQD